MQRVHVHKPGLGKGGCRRRARSARDGGKRWMPEQYYTKSVGPTSGQPPGSALHRVPPNAYLSSKPIPRFCLLCHEGGHQGNTTSSQLTKKDMRVHDTPDSLRHSTSVVSHRRELGRLIYISRATDILLYKRLDASDSPAQNQAYGGEVSIEAMVTHRTRRASTHCEYHSGLRTSASRTSWPHASRCRIHH